MTAEHQKEIKVAVATEQQVAFVSLYDSEPRDLLGRTMTEKMLIPFSDRPSCLLQMKAQELRRPNWWSCVTYSYGWLSLPKSLMVIPGDSATFSVCLCHSTQRGVAMIQAHTLAPMNVGGRLDLRIVGVAEYIHEERCVPSS